MGPADMQRGLNPPSPREEVQAQPEPEPEPMIVEGSENHRSDVAEPARERPKKGAIESGLDALGGGMREMVDLVNRLRASGIEDLGLPLPRIAVVGNQSAGKSSLIEAISGVSGSCSSNVLTSFFAC